MTCHIVHQPAHLNLSPCPRFTAVQENGQNKCAIHVHFLLIAQLGAGPYVLKLTKCGQSTDVSDIHLSTHQPMIRKERPQVFKKLSVTSSSLPECLIVGEVMGHPPTIISVFAALIKSSYFEGTASTMPASTTKSSGGAASNAKPSAYISATMREIRSVGNAPIDFVII
eukprot:354010-Chlamydomonas_euryale.AAC.6